MPYDEVNQGTQYQSADEELIYQLTTTAWGSSPSGVSVKAYNTTLQNTDVTSTVFPTNSPSVNGDVITLSPLKSLEVQHLYRVEVKFTAGGNVFECFFLVKCDH